MPATEEVDLVEAEPQPAKQREQQNQRVKQHERRDEEQSAPVARAVHASALW
jgi:hypothetical protein